MSEPTQDDRLDVRQAAQVAGVSTKTIRRYHAEGRLTAQTVAGRRGNEYRFDRAEVEAVFGNAAAKPVVKSPLEDLRQELEAMRQALAEQTATYAEADRQRTELLAEQGRTIDQLRAEVRDSRAELHQLQEHLRALPAPGDQTQADRPWWRFWRRDRP